MFKLYQDAYSVITFADCFNPLSLKKNTKKTTTTHTKPHQQQQKN